MTGGEDFDPEAEDRELLARWMAGPGKRPTPEDAARWAQAARDGRYPRITVSRPRQRQCKEEKR